MATSLLSVHLDRTDANTPWGFRLSGGTEHNSPLVINRVTPGSLAAGVGLQAGDIIIQINQNDTRQISHKVAENAIRGAGNAFDLRVERGPGGGSMMSSRASSQQAFSPPPQNQPWNQYGGAVGPYGIGDAPVGAHYTHNDFTGAGGYQEPPTAAYQAAPPRRVQPPVQPPMQQGYGGPPPPAMKPFSPPQSNQPSARPSFKKQVSAPALPANEYDIKRESDVYALLHAVDGKDAVKEVDEVVDSDEDSDDDDVKLSKSGSLSKTDVVRQRDADPAIVNNASVTGLRHVGLDLKSDQPRSLSAKRQSLPAVVYATRAFRSTSDETRQPKALQPRANASSTLRDSLPNGSTTQRAPYRQQSSESTDSVDSVSAPHVTETTVVQLTSPRSSLSSPHGGSLDSPTHEIDTRSYAAEGRAKFAALDGVTAVAKPSRASPVDDRPPSGFALPKRRFSTPATTKFAQLQLQMGLAEEKPTVAVDDTDVIEHKPATTYTLEPIFESVTEARTMNGADVISADSDLPTDIDSLAERIVARSIEGALAQISPRDPNNNASKSRDSFLQIVNSFERTNPEDTSEPIAMPKSQAPQQRNDSTGSSFPDTMPCTPAHSLSAPEYALYRDRIDIVELVDEERIEPLARDFTPQSAPPPQQVKITKTLKSPSSEEITIAIEELSMAAADPVKEIRLPTYADRPAPGGAKANVRPPRPADEIVAPPEVYKPQSPLARRLSTELDRLYGERSSSIPVRPMETFEFAIDPVEVEIEEFTIAQDDNHLDNVDDDQDDPDEGIEEFAEIELPEPKLIAKIDPIQEIVAPPAKRSPSPTPLARRLSAEVVELRRRPSGSPRPIPVHPIETFPAQLLRGSTGGDSTGEYDVDPEQSGQSNGQSNGLVTLSSASTESPPQQLQSPASGDDSRSDSPASSNNSGAVPPSRKISAPAKMQAAETIVAPPVPKDEIPVRRRVSTEQRPPRTIPIRSSNPFLGTPFSGAGGQPNIVGGPGPAGRSSVTPGPRKFGRAGQASMQQPGGSRGVPVCSHCQSSIRGPFVVAVNKSWCPDHFTCARCQCNLFHVGFVEDAGQLYCENDFAQYLAPKCSKCGQSVVGEATVAMGKEFHPQCFTCTKCNKSLGGGEFHIEEGRPYCKKDFDAMFTTKCIGCEFPIEAGDKWVEALGGNWHSECFNCSPHPRQTCQQSLEGQPFFERNGKPYCKAHSGHLKFRV